MCPPEDRKAAIIWFRTWRLPITAFSTSWITRAESSATCSMLTRLVKIVIFDLHIIFHEGQAGLDGAVISSQIVLAPALPPLAGELAQRLPGAPHNAGRGGGRLGQQKVIHCRWDLDLAFFQGLVDF